MEFAVNLLNDFAVLSKLDNYLSLLRLVVVYSLFYHKLFKNLSPLLKVELNGDLGLYILRLYYELSETLPVDF